MNSSRLIWNQSLTQARDSITQFLENDEQLQNCLALSELLTQRLRAGGRIFLCGNGGSHCDAMHFAMQMTGRFRKDRVPLGALALGDPSHLTCVANDYGFAYVFSRTVEALADDKDVLIGLSTSGNSKNVILAVQAAKERNIPTVGLLGRDGGELRSLVDLAIVVPEKTADRIQEMHKKILLIAIETVERELFASHYV